MITYDEALGMAINTAAAVRKQAVPVPLLEAVGFVLARDIVSDTDMPPFNRAVVDGYAVRAGDIANTPAELELVGTIHAGEVSKITVGPHQAARIMTGAPVPAGADTVVKMEDAHGAAGRVVIKESLPRGMGIAQRGEDVRKGEVVLPAKTRVTPAMLGLLGAAGAARVDIYRPPTAAVVTTGNELVELAKVPAPGFVRDTNGLILSALLQDLGIKWKDAGIVRDEVEQLREAFREGLKSDVLLVSGGVSVGESDLVPEAFAKEGVQTIFHKVSVRPGKPLFFGRKGETLVFGIPGNPVSTFAVFEMIIRSVLLTLTGNSRNRPTFIKATFTSGRARSDEREQMLPGMLSAGEGLPIVRTAEWHGSGDMKGLAQANCFIRIPSGTNPPVDGDIVEVHPFGAFR
jgi:molybdopterin molybdotransferase